MAARAGCYIPSSFYERHFLTIVTTVTVPSIGFIAWALLGGAPFAASLGAWISFFITWWAFNHTMKALFRGRLSLWGLFRLYFRRVGGPARSSTSSSSSATTSASSREAKEKLNPPQTSEITDNSRETEASAVWVRPEARHDRSSNNSSSSSDVRARRRRMMSSSGSSSAVQSNAERGQARGGGVVKDDRRSSSDGLRAASLYPSIYPTDNHGLRAPKERPIWLAGWVEQVRTSGQETTACGLSVLLHRCPLWYYLIEPFPTIHGH